MVPVAGRSELLDNGDDIDDSENDELIDVKPIVSFDDGGGSSQHSIDGQGSSQPMAAGSDGNFTPGNSQGKYLARCARD